MTNQPPQTSKRLFVVCDDDGTQWFIVSDSEENARTDVIEFCTGPIDDEDCACEIDGDDLYQFGDTKLPARRWAEIYEIGAIIGCSDSVYS